ncbi:esterase B1-like [Zeugodacus cucurbitae]|uniref:esterase B1-like n=1 Tax=Zeugodacus cucurbitae TaxID=28588 RepID=UPI0023D9334C|nr:esterase B1-like [Zeugodacus cucurbitae]
MVDINLPFISLLQMGVKMVAHRIQQYQATTNETTVVHTKYGQVKGVKRKTIYNHNFYAFEGVPYAKPPIGELRFRAPQSPDPWTGVRDCTSSGNVPLQKHFVLGIIQGSEDCLYLNIYVKQLKSDKPLPVMVWIYGGGFRFGEASRDIYAPDYFMERDIVLVSVNYRLGALGFLSLSDPDLHVPGNTGLKDQLLALRWIQENITSFNGDLNNVTMFGESAGAASTHLLMLAPKAQDLFHKAILQSGTALCSWVEQEPKNRAYLLAAELGYRGENIDKDVLSYLSNVSASKLIRVENELRQPHERDERVFFPFTPVVEPYESELGLLTKPFKDLLITTWSNEIPLLIGFTADEGILHHYETVKNPHLVNELGDCVAVLPKIVKQECDMQKCKELGLRLREAHFGPVEPQYSKHLYQYLELLGYRHFLVDIQRTLLARSAYASHMPTYLYRFAFDSPHFNHSRTLNSGYCIRGVCHADDLSYIFYNANAYKLPSNCGEFKTIQRMIGMWTAFAATGNPNCTEIEPIQWQPVETNDVENAQPKCLNIGEKLEFITFPHKHLKTWIRLFTNDNLF